MCFKFDPIEDVLEDVRAGVPVVITDDADRENEGDLMVSAERVTAETIAFMMIRGKGLICLSVTEEKLVQLGLPLQVTENSATYGTNFAISFDHKSVAHCGVTAEGRARTIFEAATTGAQADDFVRPGFVYPLQSRSGGVLQRRGQTEGSVDLSLLAGLRPAGVICEVMGSDGKMLSGDELLDYCKVHRLKMTSVEEILQYRLSTEKTMRRVAECEVEGLRFISKNAMCAAAPNASSDDKIRVIVFVDDATEDEHLAFVKGTPGREALVRIHSECLTGDIFDSRRCDCGSQLEDSFKMIFAQGSGVVIYLHQEGRGIGLGNKLRAYRLQEGGLDTIDANLELGYAADLRSYRPAAQILADLGISSVRLITNNPEKINEMEEAGIQVSERVVIPTYWDDFNRLYLEAKRDRFGHLIR